MKKPFDPFSESFEKDGYTIHLSLSYTGKVGDTAIMEAVCKSKLANYTANKTVIAKSGDEWKENSRWGKNLETTDGAVQWITGAVLSEAKIEDEQHTSQSIAYDNAKEAILNLIGKERDYDEVE
ncbi:MAG: hypothetical protein F4Z14_00575 [Gammaproteobacteria bacterium]|nr:hypothetical protein [Gammaproteobacteria bacterium]